MNRFLVFVLVAVAVTAGLLLVVSGGSIGHFLSAEDPLVIVIIAATALAGCSFAFGSITGDYSWVDRLWSTAPVLFVWVYAIKGGLGLRLTLGALLVTIWGIRLTYNFARKGGYSGEQDYRWPILRKQISNPFAWHLFHLLFISCFQIGLFVLFTLPFNEIYHSHGQPMSLGYIIVCLLSIFFLGIETIADEQQWKFQHVKRTNPNQIPDLDPETQQDIERGYLTSGLFRVSRHPNYFGELAFWWSIYFLGAYETAHILNWSLIGAVLLTFLFIGSTRFTESISGSKYPTYQEYQKHTAPIIPWFPLKSNTEEKSVTEDI